MGTFGNYYTYEFLRPQEDSTATKDGDTVTVTYRAPETNLNHFVRVQNPDGVTYWDFNKWTADQDIVVTRDDLHMDDDFNKDTVSRFDKNTYDLGNVYLNINSKGYMNMNAGDTYELDVFRNWQAIEGFINAKKAESEDICFIADGDYAAISSAAADVPLHRATLCGATAAWSGATTARCAIPSASARAWASRWRIPCT